MKSSPTNFYKVLKGYENYFLNADIDYKEFLNLNSDDEILEDLYTAFNISKTKSVTKPNWYKQIFLEIEDHENNTCLYIMTIEYSTVTDKFEIGVQSSNNKVFELQVKSEPDKWLFNVLVKSGLTFLFNKCKEILQKENN